VSLVLYSDELRAAIAVAKLLAAVSKMFRQWGSQEAVTGKPPIGSLDTFGHNEHVHSQISMFISCRNNEHDMT
jgi:hypothetical protein